MTSAAVNPSKVDIVLAVREWFAFPDRLAAEIVRVRHLPLRGDRHANQLAIEQRQLRVDTAHRAGATDGAVDAERDSLGQDDVKDSILRAVLRQPVGDRLLDELRIRGARDRIGYGKVDVDDLFGRDRADACVVLANRD
jgi:hypothetical protein